MGKECYRDAKPRAGRGARIQLASYILKNELQSEMSKNWSTLEGVVSASEVVEDGKVIVVLRQRGQDVKLLCSGFAKRDNPCLLLLRQLHERRLLAPGSCLENVLVRRDFVWCSIDIRNSCFNSGDCFLFICRPPPTPQLQLHVQLQLQLQPLPKPHLLPAHRKVIRKLI